MTHDPNISASAILAFVSALIMVFTGMLGDAVATRLGRFNQYAALGVRPKEYVEVQDEPALPEGVSFSQVQK
jgi:hypothetical protein